MIQFYCRYYGGGHGANSAIASFSPMLASIFAVIAIAIVAACVISFLMDAFNDKRGKSQEKDSRGQQVTRQQEVGMGQENNITKEEMSNQSENYYQTSSAPNHERILPPTGPLNNRSNNNSRSNYR